MTLVLKCANMAATLTPDQGGCIQSLTRNGVELLAPDPHRFTPPTNALNSAGFPMTPFSGRIDHGRMIANGSDIQLSPNMPPEPHAIHGHGWQRAWTIDDQSAAHARMSYIYERDEWPWTYRAEQIFELDRDTLTVTLSVQNLDQTDMPAGLGWHPYFPKQGARLAMPATAVWASDDAPGGLSPAPLDASNDLRVWRAVSELDLDHAFDMAEGEYRLAWPDRTITLLADDVFSKSVVYTPPTGDYFCVEPTVHAPNAVNSHLGDAVTGLKWLPPQAILQGKIRLTVSD